VVSKFGFFGSFFVIAISMQMNAIEVLESVSLLA
jgi:hypothetical protein